MWRGFVGVFWFVSCFVKGKYMTYMDVNKIVQTLKYTNDLGRVDVLWIKRHIGLCKEGVEGEVVG